MIEENYNEKIAYEYFKENVARAKRLGLITNQHEKALLLKKLNQNLSYEERTALDMQNRNALRILRNTIAQNPIEKTKEMVIQLLKIPVIQELIVDVDQKGILCYECQNGIVIESTTSSWTSKENYELILDHVPAKICTNPNCRETMFPAKTMKAEAKILAKIEETIAQTIGVAEDEPQKKEKQCPVCEQALLTWNGTITYKYSISDLFHLKINKLPVKALCPACGYSEGYPVIDVLLKKLQELLEQQTLELVTIS